MKKDNLKVIKNISIIGLFILLLIIFFWLLFNIRDNKLIKNIKEYIETDTKILYITDKDSYLEYPINLFKKYDIDYFYINSNNLNQIEKSKLEKIINSKYLSNILVIFDNGEIKDAIIEYKNQDTLNEFLQKNEIIPRIIGDNSNIIANVNNLLESDFSLIYLPYDLIDTTDYQDEILREISTEYEINYKRIDAYLLSNPQKNKLNSILQISSVEDQVIILIKDKKIIGSIRGINSKSDYLDELTKFNFIDELDDYITFINFNQFNNLLNSDNKNIIIIGKDDCRYCDEVTKILNGIAIDYDIEINYINVGKTDSDISNSLSKTLLNLGYNDGFTTPLTIIIEKNTLLNYIIGASNKDYFVDIFSEFGIIK